MKKFNLLLFAVILLGMASCTQKAQEEHHYLVILSMDGFRWDYPDKVETPNLDAMATNGVKAERFIPSFPTTTFASHYTMATGLHPNNHGILVNRFYAPDLDADFNKGDRSTVEDGRFYGGEPIWVTAETQDLKTATFFWVGSEADVQGIRPTYWKRYDHHFPYEQRIDTVIHWLNLPEKDRPRLVMWYFDEPDSSGHRYGPDGDSLKPVIVRLDSLVGVFRNKIKTLPHADQINFVIVSDHGMANLSPDKQIMLDQHIDTAMIALVDGWNPTMNIKVKEGFIDQVYEDLKKVDNLHVWKHGEVPERLHHGTHVRTHDLILVAKNGWSINWSWSNYTSNATHGFDNSFEDMHAIFYAEGPDFKSNHSHEPLYTIDLYPLMAHILGLQGAEVDGKFDRVSGMLK
jgi:predicted AlkP superfamily pyrophosphatase or phosphodiesterase